MPLSFVRSYSRMPPAFLLQGARHATHDILHMRDCCQPYSGNMCDCRQPYSGNMCDCRQPYSSNMYDSCQPYSSNMYDSCQPYPGNMYDSCRPYFSMCRQVRSFICHASSVVVTVPSYFYLSKRKAAGSIQIKSKFRSPFFVFLSLKIVKWDLFYQLYYPRPRFFPKTGSARKKMFVRPPKLVYCSFACRGGSHPHLRLVCCSFACRGGSHPHLRLVCCSFACRGRSHPHLRLVCCSFACRGGSHPHLRCNYTKIGGLETLFIINADSKPPILFKNVGGKRYCASPNTVTAYYVEIVLFFSL